jgi:hypothetical protein
MKSAYLIPLILEVKNLVSVSGNLTSFRSLAKIGQIKIVMNTANRIILVDLTSFYKLICHQIYKFIDY